MDEGEVGNRFFWSVFPLLLLPPPPITLPRRNPPPPLPPGMMQLEEQSILFRHPIIDGRSEKERRFENEEEKKIAPCFFTPIFMQTKTHGLSYKVAKSFSRTKKKSGCPE